MSPVGASVAGMRILHTSDWHIGRTFHTHSTLDHLRLVLAALVDVVRDRSVDVVLVAGDVFDSATPSAESYTVLAEALRGLRAAGAQVVLTSGNHDSATRLGFQSEWAGIAGIHVLTRPEQVALPVTLTDAYGPVHFYGIPFLEPALIRHRHPGETLKTHEQVLAFAMRKVRADLAVRGGRAVVLAHCFAAGVAPAAAASDVERDITAGGLDVVPVAVFDGSASPADDTPRGDTPGASALLGADQPGADQPGADQPGADQPGADQPGADLPWPDYVALGHIHGRARLTDRVRYSGAPLHYSFAEAGKPRGGWLVDLGAHHDPGHGAGRKTAGRNTAGSKIAGPKIAGRETAGLETELGIEWIDLPVPRRLSVITGELGELVADERWTAAEGDWVSAVLTDLVRPLDGMRTLQKRFPHCVALEHRPSVVADDSTTSYADRINRQSDPEIVAGFLQFVRNGVGQTDFERELVAELLGAAELSEVTL
jgi:DNA repair protein SbcD/Mre11